MFNTEIKNEPNNKIYNLERKITSNNFTKFSFYNNYTRFKESMKMKIK